MFVHDFVGARAFQMEEGTLELETRFLIKSKGPFASIKP